MFIYRWTRATFSKGYRGKLEQEDLYAHVPTLDSKNVSFKLIKFWEREVRRKKPSLLHMIFRAYGWKFVPLCILYSILEVSIQWVFYLKSIVGRNRLNKILGEKNQHTGLKLHITQSLVFTKFVRLLKKIWLQHLNL